MVEAIANLIEHVDLKSREIDEHRSHPDPRDTDRSNLTFWGSPYWDAFRKRANIFKPGSNGSDPVAGGG